MNTSEIYYCLVCTDEATKKCGCCLAVYYCSQECQRADHVYHKHEVQKKQKKQRNEGEGEKKSFDSARFAKGYGAGEGVSDTMAVEEDRRPMGDEGQQQQQQQQKKRFFHVSEETRARRKRMADLIRKIKLDTAQLSREPPLPSEETLRRQKQFVRGVVLARRENVHATEGRMVKELAELAAMFGKPFDEETFRRELYTEHARQQEELSLLQTYYQLTRAPVEQMDALNRERDTLVADFNRQVYEEWLMNGVEAEDPETGETISFLDLFRRLQKERADEEVVGRLDAQLIIARESAADETIAFFREHNQETSKVSDSAVSSSAATKRTSESLAEQENEEEARQRRRMDHLSTALDERLSFAPKTGDTGDAGGGRRVTRSTAKATPKKKVAAPKKTTTTTKSKEGEPAIVTGLTREQEQAYNTPLTTDIQFEAYASHEKQAKEKLLAVCEYRVEEGLSRGVTDAELTEEFRAQQVALINVSYDRLAQKYGEVLAFTGAQEDATIETRVTQWVETSRLKTLEVFDDREYINELATKMNWRQSLLSLTALFTTGFLGLTLGGLMFYVAHNYVYPELNADAMREIAAQQITESKTRVAQLVAESEAIFSATLADTQKAIDNLHVHKFVCLSEPAVCETVDAAYKLSLDEHGPNTLRALRLFRDGIKDDIQKAFLKGNQVASAGSDLGNLNKMANLCDEYWDQFNKTTEINEDPRRFVTLEKLLVQVRVLYDRGEGLWKVTGTDIVGLSGAVLAGRQAAYDLFFRIVNYSTQHYSALAVLEKSMTAAAAVLSRRLAERPQIAAPAVFSLAKRFGYDWMVGPGALHTIHDCPHWWRQKLWSLGFVGVDSAAVAEHRVTELINVYSEQGASGMLASLYQEGAVSMLRWAGIQYTMMMGLAGLYIGGWLIKFLGGRVLGLSFARGIWNLGAGFANGVAGFFWGGGDGETDEDEKGLGEGDKRLFDHVWDVLRDSEMDLPARDLKARAILEEYYETVFLPRKRAEAGGGIEEETAVEMGSFVQRLLEQISARATRYYTDPTRTVAAQIDAFLLEALTETKYKRLALKWIGRWKAFMWLTTEAYTNAWTMSSLLTGLWQTGLCLVSLATSQVTPVLAFVVLALYLVFVRKQKQAVTVYHTGKTVFSVYMTLLGLFPTVVGVGSFIAVQHLHNILQTFSVGDLTRVSEFMTNLSASDASLFYYNAVDTQDKLSNYSFTLGNFSESLGNLAATMETHEGLEALAIYPNDAEGLVRLINGGATI